jgi:hypothetical protein
VERSLKLLVFFSFYSSEFAQVLRVLMFQTGIL